MPGQFIDNLVLPKTEGSGIRVDKNAPTFGWRDIIGKVEIRGVGGTDPAYTVYRTPVRQFQFEVNEETFIEFHMPHDYVPGSDIYLHFHWSQNETISNGTGTDPITGGTVTWGANLSYSKGHQQASFSDPVTALTIQSLTLSGDNLNIYRHIITEVQASASTPGTGQLDTDDLEVDGLILARCYLVSNDMTVATGQVPHPYLHFVDIHYQSNNMATKNKVPSFYS